MGKKLVRKALEMLRKLAQKSESDDDDEEDEDEEDEEGDDEDDEEAKQDPYVAAWKSTGRVDGTALRRWRGAPSM